MLWLQVYDNLQQWPTAHWVRTVLISCCTCNILHTQYGELHSSWLKLCKYVVMEERTEVSSPIFHMIWLHVTAFHISEINTSSQRASHPACDSELKESQQQRNSFSIDFCQRHQQNALCTYCRTSLQETIWECAWNTSWMRSKQCGCNVISKLPQQLLEMYTKYRYR